MKKHKKVISLILAFSMLLISSPYQAYAQQNQTKFQEEESPISEQSFIEYAIQETQSDIETLVTEKESNEQKLSELKLQEQEQYESIKNDIKMLYIDSCGEEKWVSTILKENDSQTFLSHIENENCEFENYFETISEINSLIVWLNKWDTSEIRILYSLSYDELIQKIYEDIYSEAENLTGQDIVNYAEQFIGNPYVWGGNSLTNGIDCSHFVWQVLMNTGYYSGDYYTSGGWANLGSPVSSLSEAKAGDVIVYSGHVAIYDGTGGIIEAKGAAWGITHDRRADYKTIIAIRRFSYI